MSTSRTLEVLAEFVGYTDIYNPPAFRFRPNPNSVVSVLARLGGPDAERVAESLKHGDFYRIRATARGGSGEWLAELV